MSIEVSSLSVEQALSMAIQAEKDAASVYAQLKDRVKNFVMREKLTFLIAEEAKHQRILEALFQKLFPSQIPEVGKSIAPRLKLAAEEDSSIVELLEQAMDAEKLFEEFYDQLSEEVEERGAQEILQYLSSMEHSHYALLKGEYDLALRDEAYLERGDFQYDMVHIGP